MYFAFFYDVQRSNGLFRYRETCFVLCMLSTLSRWRPSSCLFPRVDIDIFLHCLMTETDIRKQIKKMVYTAIDTIFTVYSMYVSWVRETMAIMYTYFSLFDNGQCSRDHHKLLSILILQMRLLWCSFRWMSAWESLPTICGRPPAPRPLSQWVWPPSNSTFEIITMYVSYLPMNEWMNRKFSTRIVTSLLLDTLAKAQSCFANETKPKTIIDLKKQNNTNRGQWR